VDEKPEEAEKHIIKLKNTFGDDFYLELQPHDFDQQAKVNPFVIEMAEKYDVPLVVTTDSHYIEKVDKNDHDALKAIAFRKQMGQGGFTIDTNYIPTGPEMISLFKDVDEELVEKAMENTIEIADKCNAKLVRYTNALPKVIK
jgi:DNA polymerase-3 subunit alpha